MYTDDAMMSIMPRTTVNLDDDIARAVEELRRQRGVGTSEAVNTLARRGLTKSQPASGSFVQKTARLGKSRLPLDDIGEVLEVTEGSMHG